MKRSFAQISGSEESKSQHFVGIDFGTYGSGYSSCIRGCEVRVIQRYPKQSEAYPKTLTALLYRKQDWKAIAWGWDAYKTFRGKRPSEQQDYLYVDKFKLALASASDCRAMVPAQQEQAVQAYNGLPFSLTPEQVIGDYLRYLKDFAMEKLQVSWGSFSPNDVTWALSVPAGWTNASKQTMRRAAAAAGIVDSANSRRLHLVYEPEAAAVSFISNEYNPVALKEGSTLINVDCGGGSVDITNHKVIRKDGKLSLEDATHPDMILAGATILDLMMEQHVARTIGPAVFANWKEAKPADFQKLIHENFEGQKRSFDGTEPMKVELPRSILPHISPQLGDWLAETQDDVKDELWVPVEEAKTMFDHPINRIITTVRQSLDRVGGKCDFMLIVGGFGESPYLFSRLRASFQHSVRQSILSPDIPSQAVLKGTVTYAMRPEAIFARRTRFAYGVRWLKTFTPGLPERLKTYESSLDRTYCKNFFKRFIGQDALVEHDQVIKHKSYCTKKHQTHISFPIYQCENNSDLFTDLPSMTEIGSFTIDIPNPSVADDKYAFNVSFTFGTTELTVSAVDVQTQRQATISLAFSAE